MNCLEILKEAWALREGPAIFTTADKNGVPNSVYTSGPVYEDLKASVDPKFPRAAAAVLTIEELYSGAEKMI
jgi:hypothetical protein